MQRQAGNLAKLTSPSTRHIILWNAGFTSLLIALWGNGMFQNLGSFFIIVYFPLLCLPLLLGATYKNTWRAWTRQGRDRGSAPFETLRKAYLCMVLRKVVIPLIGIILFIRERRLEEKGFLIGLPLYEHYYADPYNVEPID